MLKQIILTSTLMLVSSAVSAHKFMDEKLGAGRL